LALILNGGNSTLVSPIDGIREVSNGGSEGVGGNELLVGFIETTSSVLKLEFGSSQISELVKGISGRVAFSVKSIDLEVVFDKNTVSDEFFRSAVGLLVLSLPSRPEVVVSISLDGSSEANNGKKQNEFVHI